LDADAMRLGIVLGLADLLDLALLAGEDAVAYADLVTDAERDLHRRRGGLLPLLLDRRHPLDVFLVAQHRGDFALRHRRRRLGQRPADEIAHATRLAEQVANAVVEFDFGHDVAGELFLLLHHLLAFSLARLDGDGFALHRHDDLAEELLESLDLDLALDRFLDRFLAAALHFHNI